MHLRAHTHTHLIHPVFPYSAHFKYAFEYCLIFQTYRTKPPLPSRCREYPSSLAPRPCTTTMARNLATSNSARVMSSSCAGRWTRTGTTAKWAECTASSQPASYRWSSHSHSRRRSARHCTTLSWRTKRRTRTAFPSRRWGTSRNMKHSLFFILKWHVFSYDDVSMYGGTLVCGQSMWVFSKPDMMLI